MIRIIDERSTGKTSHLMLLAKEHNALFVCSNPSAMRYKAKQYGIEGIEFISYGQFQTIQPSNQAYVIDELEDFIRSNYSDNLIAYTLSKD